MVYMCFSNKEDSIVRLSLWFDFNCRIKFAMFLVNLGGMSF